MVRWCLKYGSMGLAATNFLTNYSIINMYSKNFFLTGIKGVIGKIPAVLVSCVLPPITSGHFVESFFTSDLLKSTRTECLMCKELKTTFSHIMIASVLPTFMSWVLIMRSSQVAGFYHVPDEKLLLQSSKARKYFFSNMKRIFLKTNQNVFGRLFINYSIQFIACSFVLFYQQKQFRETIEPLNFSLAEIQYVKQLADTKK